MSGDLQIDFNTSSDPNREQVVITESTPATTPHPRNPQFDRHPDSSIRRRQQCPPDPTTRPSACVPAMRAAGSQFGSSSNSEKTITRMWASMTSQSLPSFTDMGLTT